MYIKAEIYNCLTHWQHDYWVRVRVGSTNTVRLDMSKEEETSPRRMGAEQSADVTELTSNLSIGCWITTYHTQYLYVHRRVSWDTSQYLKLGVLKWLLRIIHLVIIPPAPFLRNTDQIKFRDIQSQTVDELGGQPSSAWHLTCPVDIASWLVGGLCLSPLFVQAR